MLARVTTWDGGSADGINAAAEEMRSNMAGGPPPGLKSNGFTMLVDPDGGRVLMIGMFESQEDLDASEPVLQGMTPPQGIGSMSGKQVYEVAAEIRM